MLFVGNMLIEPLLYPISNIPSPERITRLSISVCGALMVRDSVSPCLISISQIPVNINSLKSETLKFLFTDSPKPFTELISIVIQELRGIARKISIEFIVNIINNTLCLALNLILSKL